MNTNYSGMTAAEAAYAALEGTADPHLIDKAKALEATDEWMWAWDPDNSDVVGLVHPYYDPSNRAAMVVYLPSKRQPFPDFEVGEEIQ